MSLSKKLYFESNRKTSMPEIVKLANDLLIERWEIVHRNRSYDIQLSSLRWTFGFNNLKTAAGKCLMRQRRIELSKHLLLENLDKSLEWEDTLRHEIAHAIDCFLRNGSNHDEVWKSIAKQVLATPNKTTSALVDTSAKWYAKCNNCGVESYIWRRKQNSACGKCCDKYNGGKWDERFLLNFTENAKNQLFMENNIDNQ